MSQPLLSDAAFYLFAAWYIFTGFLFAELMRHAAKQHRNAIWSFSYAAVIFGWIAMIPPMVFANSANEARRQK